MSNAIRTEERGTSFKVTVCVCEACGRFANVGQAIVHAKRCDTPLAQPEIDAKALTTPSARKAASAAKSAAELARLGKVGSGLTADEAYDAQRRGQITSDDAMNRDD